MRLLLGDTSRQGRVLARTHRALLPLGPATSIWALSCQEGLGRPHEPVGRASAEAPSWDCAPWQIVSNRGSRPGRQHLDGDLADPVPDAVWW